jgi:endonuclease/exonuclease/phosphatase family metal-dependent hydrolase
MADSLYRFVLATSMAAIACFGVQAEKMQQTTLRILSFNILHGATVEGTFDLDHVARVIVDAAPDLVALQEVDYKTRRAKGYDLATELGQRTKMTSIFARAMVFDGGEYGQALLSKYSFDSTQRLALPRTGDNEPRVAVEATLTLPGGQQIAFIGTHLDHTGAAEREAQARALNASFAGKGIPSILAGDFNATPESRTIEILKEQWAVASDGNPEPTFPSDDPKIKIDYVMVAPASRWKVVETKVLRDEVVSDHCAYLVTLALLEE